MQAYVDDFPRENPVYADALGIQSGADRLEDVSAAGHDRGIASLRAWRARFAATARPDDGAGVRADRAAMLDTLDAQLVEDELLAPWRTDPRQYVDLIGQSVFVQLVREGRPADERFGHIVARLRGMRAVTDAAIANLQHTTQPAQGLASAQLAGVLELYASLPDVAAQQGASAAVRAQLAAALPDAIAGVRAFKAFVDGPLKAHATDEPRIGAAAYTKLFPLITGVDLTPAELEQRARERASRDAGRDAADRGADVRANVAEQAGARDAATPASTRSCAPCSTRSPSSTRRPRRCSTARAPTSRRTKRSCAAPV